MAGHEHWQII
jgi:merozoite surface protein 4